MKLSIDLAEKRKKKKKTDVAVHTNADLQSSIIYLRHFWITCLCFV